VPGSIASLSWPRRLLIALVVLALLGGALMDGRRAADGARSARTGTAAGHTRAGRAAVRRTVHATVPTLDRTHAAAHRAREPRGAGKLTIPEASDKGTAANINPAASKSPWLTRATAAASSSGRRSMAATTRTRSTRAPSWTA